MKEQQKKKAAPVLVVLILIVLVGAAGIVSFLINRYKPGTEYMAGNEYFNLTDENSVALIQNGELLEEQAVLIGGEPYAAYTYVESQLNSCFYWDEETKGILLTACRTAGERRKGLHFAGCRKRIHRSRLCILQQSQPCCNPE